MARGGRARGGGDGRGTFAARRAGSSAPGLKSTRPVPRVQPAHSAGQRADRAGVSRGIRGRGKIDRHADTARSSRLAAFATLGTVLAVFGFIAAWDYLPLTDLPNHIARLTVASGRSEVLSRFYDYDFVLTTNLAVDALWLLVSAWGNDAVTFANLAMAFYGANFVLSVCVLSRVVHGRWSIWPLSSVLLVMNSVFFWGFQNYLFTVPFALHGLALWIALEGRTMRLRLAIFLPYAFLLLLGHVMAFVILPLCILGLEMQRLVLTRRGARWNDLRQRLPLALPFLLPLVYYVAIESLLGPKPYEQDTGFGSLRYRFAGLLTGFGPKVDSGAVLLVTIGFLVLIVFAVVFVVALARPASGLRLAPSGRGPVAALLLLSLFVPATISGVALIHIRYPFVLVALLLGFTSWTALRPVALVLISVLFVSLSLLQYGAAGNFFRWFNDEMADLEAVMDTLPPGSILLPLVKDEGVTATNNKLHLQAYAVPRAEAFVPTLFQGTHGLRVRPEYRDIASPVWNAVRASVVLHPQCARSVPEFSRTRRPYWLFWEERFTHVLALDPLPSRLLTGTGLACMSGAGSVSVYTAPLGRATMPGTAARSDGCKVLDETPTCYFHHHPNPWD